MFPIRKGKANSADGRSKVVTFRSAFIQKPILDTLKSVQRHAVEPGRHKRIQ